MESRAWVVYLIRCSDESLYCGITNNLKERLAAHNSGRGARYTRARQPVELIEVSSGMSKSQALKLECRVKQVPAAKKIIELKGKEKLTMNLKKELQKVNREIQALTKKIDKLITAAEKPEKAKAKKTKAKPGRKIAAKKQAAKKPADRKPAGLSAAEVVLGAIEKSSDGIDTAALMKATGFNQRKINNNIYKLKKQGKIKNEKKGVYAMA